MARTLTLLAGGALLVLTVGISLLSPAQMDSMQEGFMTPILAFEFVRSPAEVYNLFALQVSKTSGVVATCAELNSTASYRITALDAINQMDSAYILAYTAFMVFLANLRFGAEGNRRFLAATWILAIVALVFDILENIALLGITEALGYCLVWSQQQNGPAIIQDWVSLLIPFTQIKWFAIPLAFLLMGRSPLPETKVAVWFRYFSVGSAILALLLLLVGIFYRPFVIEGMALFVGLCFLTGFLETLFNKPLRTET